MNVLRQKVLSGNIGYICSSCTRKFAKPSPIVHAIRGYATDDNSKRGVRGRASQLLKRLGVDIGADPVESSQPTRDRPRQSRTKATRVKTPEPVNEGDEDVEIRHFDQLDDGRIVPSLSDGGLEGAIKSHVDDLQRDIDDAAKAQISNAQDIQIARDNAQETSAADDAFLEFLQQSDPSISTDHVHGKPDDDTREMRDIIQRIRIPLENFPILLHEPLAKLNEYLIRTAAQGPSANVPLWSQYLKCRTALLRNPTSVSFDCWEVLWYFLSFHNQQQKLQKAKRILQLRRDIEQAGFKFTLDDRLLTCIEAKVIVGEKLAALSDWQQAEDQLVKNEDEALSAKYWALGSKIAGRFSHIDRATELATKHFAASTTHRDPTVLINLMDAYISSSRPLAVQEAMATYMRLLNYFDNKLTMEIYDECIGIFMRARRADLAMIVFTDLMFSSRTLYSPRVYKAQYRNADLDSLTYSPEELSWLNDESPIQGPRNHRNKFFFSKLVKKMIGDGHTDWGYAICKQMATLGFGADARVWNGIIGAWLRSGNKGNKLKAEEVAWQLINERIRFVKLRAMRRSNGGIFKFYDSSSRKGYYNLADNGTSGTSATPETFAILAEHYRLTNQGSKLQDVYDVIERSAILVHPDVLNTLLRYELSRDCHDRMWQLYIQFTQDYSVRPNYTTFAILWKASIATSIRLGRNKGEIVKSSSEAFPDHRRLFVELRSWASHLRSTPMPQEVYYEIIRAFGYADDQIGTGVAISSLRLHFNAYANQQILRSVVLQLANAVEVTQQEPTSFVRRRRRLNIDKTVKQRIVSLSNVVNHFQSVRDSIAVAKGQKVIRELEGDEWGAAMIPILGQLLKHVVLTRLMSAGVSENEVNTRFEKAVNAAVLEMQPEHMALDAVQMWEEFESRPLMMS